MTPVILQIVLAKPINCFFDQVELISLSNEVVHFTTYLEAFSIWYTLVEDLMTDEIISDLPETSQIDVLSCSEVFLVALKML